MTAAIETHDLAKRFGDVVAVDSLDLTVERGEAYGFLGPNGAGKSTTIDLLLNFLQPTAGSATVLGHDTRDESLAIRRRVGALPEGADCYPRSTGREHVAFAGDVKGVDVDPDGVLDRVGLDPGDRARYVRGYSKGMRQRLALGMALAGDPDLLILDEPATGLDPTGQLEMRDIVREEIERGTTVFFSSHQLQAVEAVCDRVGILHEGRLVAEDTIEGLRARPGGGYSVSIRCAEAPDGELGLPDLDGITAVSRSDGPDRPGTDDGDGEWLTVSCREPADRVAAIRHADRVATLVDVETEAPSLESLFERHVTNDGATRRDAPEVRA